MEKGIVIYFRRDSVVNHKAECKRCNASWTDIAQVAETCPSCNCDKIKFFDRDCHRAGDIIDLFPYEGGADNINGDQIFVSAGTYDAILKRLKVGDFTELKSELLRSGKRTRKKYFVDVTNDFFGEKSIKERS